MKVNTKQGEYMTTKEKTLSRHEAFKKARANKGCPYSFDVGQGWIGWARYCEWRKRCITWIEKNGICVH